jgi:hypothetical protein
MDIEGIWAASLCVLIANWLNPSIIPIWIIDIAWVIVIVLALPAIVLIGLAIIAGLAG